MHMVDDCHVFCERDSEEEIVHVFGQLVRQEHPTQMPEAGAGGAGGAGGAARSRGGGGSRGSRGTSGRNSRGAS